VTASQAPYTIHAWLALIPPSLHVPLLYLVPVLVAVLVYPFVVRHVVRKMDAALRKINSLGASILRAKDKDPASRLDNIATGIHLPNQKVNISKIGLDIGGSLAKLVYFEPTNHKVSDSDEEFDSGAAAAAAAATTTAEEYEEPVAGGTLRFVKFEVRKLHELLDFMKGTPLALFWRTWADCVRYCSEQTSY